MADDTVEIREVKYANSGRDDFPVMLKRQKLPKKFSLNQPGQTYEEDYINPQDIKVSYFKNFFNKFFFYFFYSLVRRRIEDFWQNFPNQWL